MIEWINGNVMSLVVTFNTNNLTLNQNAVTHFSESRYVTVGIDHQKHALVIHPVTKEELEMNVFLPEQMHKISIGNGYGKISNKQMCDQIARYLDKELIGQKFYASYQTRDRMLVISFDNPVQQEESHG